MCICFYLIMSSLIVILKTIFVLADLYIQINIFVGKFLTPLNCNFLRFGDFFYVYYSSAISAVMCVGRNFFPFYRNHVVSAKCIAANFWILDNIFPVMQ